MKKLYYSIGETSRLTGVEPHVLRYWESIFPELKPDKNRAGKRVYKDKDFQVIHTLKDLIQQKKYSTAGARNVLKEQKKSLTDKVDPMTLPSEVIHDLSRVRIFLSDLLKKI